ncbi:MAG: hypothetical protein ABI193_12750, partial [Minicystis sp.]
ALYQALGSDNFEATRGGFDDEPVQQNSVVLAITVTLKHIPIFSEIRQAVTLTGATATGTVTDPEGNAPADAGTITVTL